MADYTTPALVSAAVNANDPNSPLLQLVCSSASRLVDSFCGRQFGPGVGGTVREYQPTNENLVVIHDASAITAIKSDDKFDHTFSTTWTLNTDYVLDPVNQIGPNGQSGWPYQSIVGIGNRWFPIAGITTGVSTRWWPITRYPKNTVQVTGTFGWAAVPDDVSLATLFLAAEMFKAAKEAPFGTAGLGDFGPVTIKGNRRVNDLLAPYQACVVVA